MLKFECVLWDHSKNVSLKFLAQLLVILLELLIKEWHGVVVNRDFWGQISFSRRV